MEEEEDNGIHWMTAVQLAAYKAVNGSQCPAQTKAAQLPVVKPRVSLRTEEEGEEEDVESLFFHGPRDGRHERPAAEGTVEGTDSRHSRVSALERFRNWSAVWDSLLIC